ncbi:unnamed protein product [Closterium sp. Naga37s-1]|nr:unnamed protein product [Closterium sp. Naga37s-1]
MSQSNSQQITPPPAAPLIHAPLRVPPQPVVPPLASQQAQAPVAGRVAAGTGLRLPWVPPVADVEFVGVGGRAVGAQYPSALLLVRVPEATLRQLWRLAESMRALLLIQVQAHASLTLVPGNTIEEGPWDDCLDAADQLALLLAHVLAAPARGGVAAVGQLDTAVRGLRRYLRAGSGADAIAASTLVVREVWRTLSGLLAALEADRM